MNVQQLIACVCIDCIFVSLFVAVSTRANNCQTVRVCFQLRMIELHNNIL